MACEIRIERKGGGIDQIAAQLNLGNCVHLCHIIEKDWPCFGNTGGDYFLMVPSEVWLWSDNYNVSWSCHAVDTTSNWVSEVFESLPIFMMKRRGFKKIVRENKMKKSKFCFAYFHLWRCAYFWNKQKFCRPRITWSDRYQESWYYLLDQTCKSIQSTWLMFFWLS